MLTNIRSVLLKKSFNTSCHNRTILFLKQKEKKEVTSFIPLVLRERFLEEDCYVGDVKDGEEEGCHRWIDEPVALSNKVNNFSPHLTISKI